MASTKIEWADKVWNPITGCSPISEGCNNCYARRMANRLKGRCGYPADDPFRVMAHFGRVQEPLGWKKPKRVFVCSMGDLFHKDVNFFWIDEVFEYMLRAPHHTYMVLTKRPQRLYEWCDSTGNRSELLQRSRAWIGVTAENQKRADERTPILLQIPAAVRFVSVEPMLGPVDFDEIKIGCAHRPLYCACSADCDHAKLDWVISGGETGAGARPMHPDWARSLRDQAVSAGVPFFFKGWGRWIQNPSNAGKRTLDGREWNEFPDDRQ